MASIYTHEGATLYVSGYVKPAKQTRRARRRARGRARERSLVEQLRDVRFTLPRLVVDEVDSYPIERDLSVSFKLKGMGRGLISALFSAPTLGPRLIEQLQEQPPTRYEPTPTRYRGRRR
jgi:hypothetical protein